MKTKHTAMLFAAALGMSTIIATAPSAMAFDANFDAGNRRIVMDFDSYENALAWWDTEMDGWNIAGIKSNVDAILADPMGVGFPCLTGSAAAQQAACPNIYAARQTWLFTSGAYNINSVMNILGGQAPIVRNVDEIVISGNISNVNNPSTPGDEDMYANINQKFSDLFNDGDDIGRMIMPDRVVINTSGTVTTSNLLNICNVNRLLQLKRNGFNKYDTGGNYVGWVDGTYSNALIELNGLPGAVLDLSDLAFPVSGVDLGVAYQYTYYNDFAPDWISYKADTSDAQMLLNCTGHGGSGSMTPDTTVITPDWAASLLEPSIISMVLNNIPDFEVPVGVTVMIQGEAYEVVAGNFGIKTLEKKDTSSPDPGDPDPGTPTPGDTGDNDGTADVPNTDNGSSKGEGSPNTGIFGALKGGAAGSALLSAVAGSVVALGWFIRRKHLQR